MMEFLGPTGQMVATVGGSLAAAFLLFAGLLPKIFNSIKADNLDSGVLKRLRIAEDRINELSNIIHEHAIDITLAQMIILTMHQRMLEHATPIPEEAEEYIHSIKSGRARKFANKEGYHDPSKSKL